ncbi:MAG: DedA family protein [Candidatus Marsarchaeota archaeon]|jgi:membrane protein DedA with SNARE-associated domain|nr:DedA family protein [Candidatus Marsarchaeota archaeon]MCL5418412.1 DedA family protein [Candidatus Marsarchaeota archaeon]
MTGLISIAISFVSSSYATISLLVKHYGYAAIFVLMLLEGSSIPVPSEVVLPLVGLFAKEGLLKLYLGVIAALLGSIAGLAIDYYIGYFIGKDIVYKHLKRFHIKQESLDAFDKWFERNGLAAVFLSRLIPALRTLMSFPAGFAKMPPRKFFAYSIAGSLIWDVVLALYGYYALSTSNAVLLMTSIGLFALVLYAIYYIAKKRMK